ncbi:MAG: exodeoxyribonuclease VII large subunit [Terrimicrobiaceae bacterium]
MQLGLDLQSAPSLQPAPKIHSVTEVTRRVRELIEKGVGEVWVEGEISNLRRQASGHQYFTLKDPSCQLSCVLFSGAAAALRGVRLADGQSIQAFGQLSVYEPRGQYQMIVRLVQERGAGALQEKFEALKRKLAAEGLFDPEKKRPLPRFPRRIGLVTSPTGAAIQDFLNVLHRRHPGIEVFINPVRVQGKGAAAEIARAIREFGEAEKHGLPAMDVLVVTRGGGSIEDLWEFNEEAVARAIAASPIPVVSAVGHEIDFTIADFAADLRAATPSAAAEILAADRMEILSSLRQMAARIARAGRGRLDLAEARLSAISQSAALREPARRLLELRQTSDRAADAIHQAAGLALEQKKTSLRHSSARLAAQFPTRAIRESRLHCRMILQRMGEPVRRELTARRARLDRASGILGSLSPEATLSRGFTITMDDSGKPLTTARKIATGTKLRTRFHDGEVDSTVEE